MPTDLALDSDKDIYQDDGNDLALVSGQRQLQQSIGIDVFDELQDFVGGKLTGQRIGLLEERIRQGLNEDPQVGTVEQVTVEEYDRRTDAVTVSVQVTENDDFTLTLEG